jgi:hypothetical protein
MSDPTPEKVVSTVPAATPTLAAGPITRNQHKKNKEERNADYDDESKDAARKTFKAKDVFKGKIAKLSGSVFLLSEEGGKHNQFTETLAAIKKYMYQWYRTVPVPPASLVTTVYNIIRRTNVPCITRAHLR